MTYSRKASSLKARIKDRSACTSSSRRRRPNHERAAGAEPRKKLQVTASIAGFVARGREWRGRGAAGSERSRQDHGLLHGGGAHQVRTRRDLSRQSGHYPSAHAPASAAGTGLPTARTVDISPPVGLEQYHGDTRDTPRS